jgi:hypothetical protein
MSKVFLRKQFSNYLGENRALDDIIVRYEADIQPTPTPTPLPITPTPTNTPTSSLTPTPSITPSITPTKTTSPTPTPTITQTNTPSGTPNITPTSTITPTPTRTPNVDRTLGRIISTGGSLSGTTFAINYNSVVYPISTLFDPTTLSGTIPVAYPSPGTLYNFVLVPDSGFTISSVGISFGAFNRIRITTGASAGPNLWNCVVDYMLNGAVLFTDTGNLISVSSSSGFGQTWNINLTIDTGGPFFQVMAKELANELGDNLTTENGDVLEIQS